MRVGDKVLVHDAGNADLRLVPAVVAIVESAKGSSDICIRIGTADDVRRVVRPRRPAVHLDPVDSTELCWRCDAIIAGTADGKQRSE